MGIKIDVAQQKGDWGATSTDVQMALRFCNLNYVEAGEMVARFIDADILDKMGSRWTDAVQYLETIVETMKAALVRLEVSEDRALGRKRRIE
jgi:hypothetical protein